MSTLLIAQNQIKSGNFYSATEQGGPRWGLPVPGDDNAGSFRLMPSGVPADFTHTGVTTSAGAVEGSSVVDSAFSYFGDDYFIGATIEITTGSYAGQSSTVTDFVQSNGTFTVSPLFSGRIEADVGYILTLSYASRDFQLLLTASGDAGTATLKMSHDGGTTWLGRDSPDQANYLGERTIDTNGSACGCLLYLPTSQTVLYFYEESNQYVKVRKSTNYGFTWGSEISIGTYASLICNAILLSSGRIMLLLRNLNVSCRIYYSDDDATTWNQLTTSGLDINTNCIFPLYDGTIMSLYDSGSSTGGATAGWQKSTDGGSTWTTGTTGPTGTYIPCGTQLPSGRIIVVTSHYSAPNWARKVYYSDDSCANWTLADTLDTTAAAGGTYNNNVFEDLNGDLYSCWDGTSYFYRSTDSGANWAAGKTLATGTRSYANMAVCGESILAALWGSGGVGNVVQRRGMWEAYSANDCPVPKSLAPLALACGAEITFYGSAGTAADLWTCEADYDYAMSNLTVDPPSIAWQSQTSDAACYVILDAGSGKKFYCDGVALFGSNLRNLSFQMSNDREDWASPGVDETISFEIATGTVDSCSGNTIVDSSLLASYEDHELAGYYIRFNPQSTEGLSFKIADNIGSYIIVDTAAAWNSFATFPLSYYLPTSCPFVIFGNRVAKTFTAGLYRYIRLSIGAQETYDAYYRIGTMVAGKTITLTEAWVAPQFSETIESGLSYVETAHGGIFSVDEFGDSRRIWELSWVASPYGRKEMLSTLSLMRGKGFCLVPDSGTMTDCRLMTQAGDVRQSDPIGLTKYNMSVTMRELI